MLIKRVTDASGQPDDKQQGESSKRAMREISNTAREERRRQRGGEVGGEGGRRRGAGRELDDTEGMEENKEGTNRGVSGLQIALGSGSGNAGRAGAAAAGDPTPDKQRGVRQVCVRLDGVERRFNCMGLDVSIIDFSLSRLRCGKCGRETEERGWERGGGGGGYGGILPPQTALPSCFESFNK